MPETWQEGGFGLYVHWPFCQSKCPYCDFNSHVVERVDQRAWADALSAEVARHAAETPGRVLGSIYFGGGTPSLMTEHTVAAVLAAADQGWTLANDVEITLEANPSSVEADRFAGYRAAGVNRVSLGVQALRDPDLRKLGRLHDTAAARRAIEVAQETFGRVSIDLIYARQDQSEEDWAAELDEALSLGLDHYALYQLTIEPGTAFGDRFARGRLPDLPDEDRSFRLWETTQEMCSAAGAPGYEISNHARPGQESRHNRIYWASGDWVGVGPGAHGRLTLDGTRIATEGIRAPGAWLASVRERGHGDSTRETLSARETRDELVLMGLRTRDGIDLDRVARAAPDEPELALDAMKAAGLVEIEGRTLRATEAGRVLLNSVIAEILPD